MYTNNLYRWGDGAFITQIPTPDEDAWLYTNEWIFQGDRFFWESGSLALHRIKTWTFADGVSNLMTAGDDPTRGYADLGTDGVQMVWNQGQREDPNAIYPNLSTMVSPYSTTTAGLQPRVLRTDISGASFGTSAWVVRCGFAARQVVMAPISDSSPMGTLVVRLSDGVAWLLRDGQRADFGWREPLALTCDEVFVLVDEWPDKSKPSHFNIARIRLDSLGAGMPPPAP